MSPTPSRRAFLAATVGVATVAAGCQSNHGATGVVVHNERDESISVALTITDAGASDPRLDETLELESCEQETPTDDGKLPTNAEYSVAVDVTDGPSETFDWADVSLERAPLHVVIDASENILFALQVA